MSEIRDTELSETSAEGKEKKEESAPLTSGQVGQGLVRKFINKLFK